MSISFIDSLTTKKYTYTREIHEKVIFKANSLVYELHHPAFNPYLFVSPKNRIRVPFHRPKKQYSRTLTRWHKQHLRLLSGLEDISPISDETGYAFQRVCDRVRCSCRNSCRPTIRKNDFMIHNCYVFCYPVLQIACY